jgi:hypothetical protein
MLHQIKCGARQRTAVQGFRYLALKLTVMTLPPISPQLSARAKAATFQGIVTHIKYKFLKHLRKLLPRLIISELQFLLYSIYQKTNILIRAIGFFYLSLANHIVPWKSTLKP